MGKTGVKTTYVSFTCKECGKEFSKTKSQLSGYKNRTPITCSNECRKIYVGKQKALLKNGKELTCSHCNKKYYRSAAQAVFSQFCSIECQSEAFSGEGNPFWNKSHSEETKKKISNSRKGKNLNNKNALGYKHSTEAKKRIAEASKKLWEENKEKMLASLPRGENHRYYKPKELRRHRKQFTPRQRREWKAKECAFCGSKEHLELDHIIPIFDGGKNIKENAQTLCRGCNLWKIKHVDLPRRHAALAILRDTDLSNCS